jgi:putative membrane protein
MTSKHYLGLGILALSAGAGSANAAPRAATLDDRGIFAVYDQVNGFDIETASLGAVKGQSEDVRALAAMVLRDHSSVRQMTRDLAQKLGISYQVPDQDGASQSHAQALVGLRSKSGTAFDRAYLEHEIEFHRTAIKAVKESLLPAVSNAELKKLISDVLPAFEQHLSHTLEVAGRLGVAIR